MENQLRQIEQIDYWQVAYSVYLKLVGLICICLGVFYWIRLVGVYPGSLWRFDLMPWHWQLLSSALAVFYPVAGIGLWMRSPWGIILWIIAGLSESLALTVYRAEFSYKPLVAVLHIVLFLVFIGLYFFNSIKKKQKAEVLTEY